MKHILVIFLFFLGLNGFSQGIPQKYFIQFKDKNGTPFDTLNPQNFLTQRAIDRRNAQGIAITSQDLPVTPSYVTAVAATGVQVFTRCKWFNGITIRVTDSTVIPTIAALPFVQSTTKVTSYNFYYKKGGDGKFKREEMIKSSRTMPPASPRSVTGYDYGPSFNQIHLMNGEVLHNMGYRGQGKIIAILDAGFQNADINPCFDSLRANNQILGTVDFVNPGGNVYQEHYHGGAVLSTMGACVPGQLIGTAPKASYWLIRTEDANTENIVEEYNWVVGAEFADSVGADVINSSLGYTQFDNDWMDHTCADMNGYTNPSSRGANIAANKGMAISISSGNEGGSAWICVSSPSDALDALGVGATDEFGVYAYFSSAGTVNGNYVKPNIAAQGENVYVAYPDSSFNYGSGTSFSSPINAGMIACLWQARPTIDQFHLRLAIEQSANQYTHPDSLLGYGIPDYSKANLILTTGSHVMANVMAYPNPFNEAFALSLDKNISGKVLLTFYSVAGETVLTREVYKSSGTNSNITVGNLSSLASGMYILKISNGEQTDYLHMVKVGQ